MPRNTMSKSFYIRLGDMFEASLSTRQAVSLIANKVPKATVTEVTVDFEGITFISRSFAHEFLRFEERAPYKVKRINLEPDIQKIFKIVDASRHTSHSHWEPEITDSAISL